jgi:hypothetical protein
VGRGADVKDSLFVLSVIAEQMAARCRDGVKRLDVASKHTREASAGVIPRRPNLTRLTDEIGILFEAAVERFEAVANGVQAGGLAG